MTGIEGSRGPSTKELLFTCEWMLVLALPKLREYAHPTQSRLCLGA